MCFSELTPKFQVFRLIAYVANHSAKYVFDLCHYRVLVAWIITSPQICQYYNLRGYIFDILAWHPRYKNFCLTSQKWILSWPLTRFIFGMSTPFSVGTSKNKHVVLNPTTTPPTNHHNGVYQPSKTSPVMVGLWIYLAVISRLSPMKFIPAISTMFVGEFMWIRIFDDLMLDGLGGLLSVEQSDPPFPISPFSLDDFHGWDSNHRYGDFLKEGKGVPL